MKRVGFALALAAIGCSSAPPDPWVGRFSGNNHEVDTVCGQAPAAPRDTAYTAEIQRDSAGLFIAGRCRLALEPSSSTYATIPSDTCEAALPDGSLATYSYSGSATLRGDHLTLSLVARIESATQCFEATSMIEADRE